MVEVWQIFLVHLFTIELHGSRHNLLVSGFVPFVAGVLKLDVLLLWLILVTLHDGAVVCPIGAPCQLIGATASEGLGEVSESLHGVELLGIELRQLVEVELALQVARRVLPLADLCLVGCFLLNQSDTVDTFIHTDGVLPVVRAVGILRVVFDTHSLVGSHVADHDILLHLAGLVARLIHSIAALLDAVARQIAACAAGIADGHRERARHVALQRYWCPFLRFHRYIVLGVVCWTARLGVYIDTEHAEVAGLARPHPVVCLTAKLTHRFGQGEHQANVLIVAIGGQEILVTLVEGLKLHAEGRVLGLDFLEHHVLDGIDELAALVLCYPVDAERVHIGGDIFLLYHETHEELLVRQFLLE